MQPDLLQIRALGANFHVLRDSRGLYLIDAGFVGARAQLLRALRRKGWDRERLIGIIVTHGHLDHILNVGRIASDTGAWVAAPHLDAQHYQGQARHQGWARVTGVFEAIGRPLLGFRSFTPDRMLDDGDTLDVWHGLRVVHLPGHTAGHSGFYCQTLRLLFCGDLFASFPSLAHLPPAIFDSSHEQVPFSVAKALDLDLAGVLPNHGDCASPEEHLRRLRLLYRRHRKPSRRRQGSLLRRS